MQSLLLVRQCRHPAVHRMRLYIWIHPSHPPFWFEHSKLLLVKKNMDMYEGIAFINIATCETSQVITSRHFSSLLFTSLHFYIYSNFFGSYELKGKYNTHSDEPILGQILNYFLYQTLLTIWKLQQTSLMELFHWKPQRRTICYQLHFYQIQYLIFPSDVDYDN